MGEPDGATRVRRWDQLLFWGFMGSLALVRAGRLEERDPYWQIRAGAENLAGIPLVRPDTWSWSGVEGNWYPNSPLWNVLLAISYQAAGFWGFFVLSATIIGLLLVMVYLLSRRLGFRLLPGMAGLLAVFAAAFPMFNARATTAVQVLLLVAVYVALRLSDRSTTTSAGVLLGTVFAVAVGLSILGNWLHLSFLILGPGLAAVWAVIWLLTPGLTAAKRWALAVVGGIGWFVGLLLSPLGLSLGLERTRAVQEACQGLIVEWSSPFHTYVPRQFLFVLAVALLVAGGTAWWLFRRWRGGGEIRELAALAMIGVPAALAGVTAIRFLGVSLLVLAPVAAAAATRIVDGLRGRLGSSPRATPVMAKLREYSTGRFWRVVLSATLLVLSPGVVYLAAQHGAPPERGLVAQLPSGCNLFSRAGYAGTAVLLRPDVQVWMDGRADFFGRDMMILGYAYFGGSTEEPVPDGATCVLLDAARDNSGVGDRLRATPGWRLVASDRGFQLWLPGDTR